MTKDQQTRSLAVAKVLGSALTEAARASFPDARLRMARAAKEASSFAATEHERVEVKRRVAESILLLACSRNESWQAVRASFEKVRAFGFTDADRHVQDAALLARWCIDNRHRIDAALEEVRRARLHVLSLESPTERHSSGTADARGRSTRASFPTGTSLVSSRASCSPNTPTAS